MKSKQGQHSETAQGQPGGLADITLVDSKEVCAALSMSPNWLHNEVRAGRFPQPLRHGSRCTRWRAADIRQYLLERAAMPQAETIAMVTARAKKASAAAQLKRAAAGPTASNIESGASAVRRTGVAA